MSAARDAARREQEGPLGKAPAAIPPLGPEARLARAVIVAREGSLAREVLRRFLRHRLAIGGSAILIAVVAAAVLAPLVAPQDPTRIDLASVREPPSLRHWFGADLSGRDVWSRVVYGTRTSLVVGFGAVSLYVLIGTVLGLLAGHLGGIVDQVLMRFTDSVLSIPTLLIVIVFVSVVGPSLLSVIAVIGLLGWPPTARLVRGQLLTLRELEFVTSARAVGASDARIVLHHLLPNVLGPLTVVFTFGVANAILLEAGLSFLGLGVRPPTPSLGVMIQEARSPSVLFEMPWLWLTPGTAIALTVLAVNLVGDGLRDALDPRATRRA